MFGRKNSSASRQSADLSERWPWLLEQHPILPIPVQLTAGRGGSDTHTPFVAVPPDATQTLTVIADGTTGAQGTVTGVPVGGRWTTINCVYPGGTPGPVTCEAPYPQGTLVDLTATPQPNSYFVGWTGGTCSGTATRCVSCTVPSATASEIILASVQTRRVDPASRQATSGAPVTSTARRKPPHASSQASSRWRRIWRSTSRNARRAGAGMARC